MLQWEEKFLTFSILESISQALFLIRKVVIFTKKMLHFFFIVVVQKAFSSICKDRINIPK